jgi:tetratricopeptide (TPR) repeat protein
MADGDRPPSDAEDAAVAKAAGSKRPASAVPEAPASEPAAAGQPVGGAASDAKPLQPIPEEAAAAAIEIETASFNRVTPGTSTLDDVKKHWGVAKEIRKQQGAMIYLYAVDPFDQVEVMFYEGKLTSIIIRLSGTFDADAVAEQLSLSKIRPVFVSNELGEILGQSYPERGVLFSFAPGPTPGKPSMKVAQIILEPVTAEPFVLRAETDLENQAESSLKDLEVAVKMAPENARARWLQARALVLVGEAGKAQPAIQEAVRLEPNNAQYHLTHAQILGQMGRFHEAAEGAENAAAMSGQRPHIKVRALCLLGDLAGSGPQPDYKRAMQHHSQAVKMAEALAGDPHPAIRQPAKEVLVDAHLGAAQDIAWGSWNNKEIAVAAWLKRASEFADDLIQNDGGAGELRFRVATRALAACVGLQGKLDPAPWAEQATRVGQELVQGTASPAHKQELQREVGLALYDAVQVFQMRNERTAAEKFGKLATEFLEAARPSKGRPADLYLLGRLYFRMGALRASGESNHRAAVEWFEKAVATLQDAAPQVSSSERGRLGETFVSMGVSYWETSQRDKAVQITRQGVDLMEKAVQDGSLAKTALDVAYNNLATMHRQLGQNDQAKVYAEKVSKKNDTLQR